MKNISPHSDRPIHGILIFLIGLLLIALTIHFEEYFFIINRSDSYRVVFKDKQGSISIIKVKIPDKVLGYKPSPDITCTALKEYRNRLLYSVEYSFDKNNRRITPVSARVIRKGCILFFGCSVAFGEGVNGNETLPYYVGCGAPGYLP